VVLQRDLTDLYPWIADFIDFDDDDPNYDHDHHGVIAVPNSRGAANYADYYASATRHYHTTSPLFSPKLQTIEELSELVSKDRGGCHNKSIVNTGDIAQDRSVTFNLALCES
jgi:hypothetical protein